MKQVIIYPGRFQPMLSHHAEVYSQLQTQFPEADVYIGTSDKVESGKSPFNFKEKQMIANAHGIDPNKVLLAKRPYHKDDYPFDEDNTVIIFAVGEKDLDRFPFNNVDPETDLDMTVRGEPKPKYYQKINTYRTDPKPMAERGYITLAPTIKTGDEIASASAFRDALKNAPDKESAEKVYTKQFGNFDPKIFELIYNKITGQNEMKEEINRIRKLAGLEPVMESFDPAMEPSREDEMYDELLTAYEQGEQQLAKAMGISEQELDQEMTEFAMDHGLHMDDDRDEVVHGYIEQVVADADHKEYESVELEEDAGEYSYTLEYNGESNGYSIHKLAITSPEGETKVVGDDFTYFDVEGDELQAELESWFNNGHGIGDEEDELDEVAGPEGEQPEQPEGGEKVIPVNKPIQLRGDSIWDEDGKNPESVNVTEVTVTSEIDEDGYAHVSVGHDGPWTVYTDSGFEAEISKIVGFDVQFTEQGMQEEGEASLEGNTEDSVGMQEELDRLTSLSGIEEAPMPDFDKGERPKNAKERAAYRKWKKSNAAGKKDDDAPLTISPKDRKDAEARPANAAAADPAKAEFTDITLKGMKVDGKSIPSSQRAKSIANQFPEDADLNDPAIKKEVFLKFTAKRPDLMFGEINARISNDAEGLAISDRLSPIVRQLEDSRNIMELEPEDKSFALKILNNAIHNMDLVKSTEIDKQIDVEPMQLDTDDEDEKEYDDDAMVPVLDMEDDAEFEKESLDLSSIRDEFGVNEGRLKDIIQDAMDMSKEEFDAEYKGQYDYDQLQKEYGDEAIDEGGKKCPQCGMVDCPCEPGECDCPPVEEQSVNEDKNMFNDLRIDDDTHIMDGNKELTLDEVGPGFYLLGYDRDGRCFEMSKTSKENAKDNITGYGEYKVSDADITDFDGARYYYNDNMSDGGVLNIKEAAKETIDNTIDVAINELKQLAGI